MLKYSVAALIKRNNEFLAVKRSKNEKEHPCLWGLPAISFKPPELPEEEKRMAKEKLSCEIKIKAFLGAIYQERPNYKLILLLYEA